HLRHPLIGRQLHGLLHEKAAALWSEVEVMPVEYTFTDWSTVDTILQLSSAVVALKHDQPELADDLSAWLRATDAASKAGTFFATIPMYFASARKAKRY